MKPKHTVIDNFLSDDEFIKVKDMMMGDLFPWYLNVGRVSRDDGDYQLTHTFYRDYCVESNWMGYIKPIVMKLNPVALIRIKANLRPKESENRLGDFHCDLNLKKKTGLFTSIFYINTNNGYTVLRDGSKIESVENRLLTFPYSIMHAGSSCTDENIRVLINLNYII